MDAKSLQFIIPLLIFLPLLYFRMRRSLKPQKLKPQTLLIRPAVIILVACMVLAASPPREPDIPWFGLAALLGAAGGWYWGKLTQLHLHPEDGTVMATGSQAGMIVLIVLVLFRYGIRAGTGIEGSPMHLNVALVTDLSITFSAFLFSARGLEIFLRARDVMRAPS